MIVTVSDDEETLKVEVVEQQSESKEPVATTSVAKTDTSDVAKKQRKFERNPFEISIAGLPTGIVMPTVSSAEGGRLRAVTLTDPKAMSTAEKKTQREALEQSVLKGK